MLETLNLTRMASALADHSSKRLTLVAKNVAQASTPGYQALDLQDFASVYGDTPQGGMRATRPGHFTAGGSVMTADTIVKTDGASPNGNTVSVEEQMVNSVTIRKDHNMAMAVYGNARDILRASLGRR